jgi:NAD(P)-dependent dehydrogenase (short-subunit alcohol dehydrogenase family)
MPSREIPLVLVTGGARGITARCVIGLANHKPGRFLLLGRTELSGQEIPGLDQAHDEPALKKLVIE